MSRPVVDMTNHEYVQDDSVSGQKNIAHARTHVLVQLERVGLADVLEEMCLIPCSILVLVYLPFRNGLPYNVVRGGNGGTPDRALGRSNCSLPWVVVCGLQRMSGRSRSRREVRKISTVDVMVVPVPVLYVATPDNTNRNGQRGQNGSATRLLPHLTCGSGQRITEPGHLAAKQNPHMTR